MPPCFLLARIPIGTGYNCSLKQNVMQNIYDSQNNTEHNQALGKETKGRYSIACKKVQTKHKKTPQKKNETRKAFGIECQTVQGG